jgi:hypothetical protein
MNTREFFTAGNATATLKSLASGAHFTYKASRPKDERDNVNFPTFVSVLTGNDNENDFTFLGTIFPDGNFRHGRNSHISPDAPSAKGFEWLWRNADHLPADKAELLPTCNCARCGRKLTVPTSIENALGPECAKKV